MLLGVINLNDCRGARADGLHRNYVTADTVNPQAT
jgi:hypothetical protein